MRRLRYFQRKSPGTHGARSHLATPRADSTRRTSAKSVVYPNRALTGLHAPPSPPFNSRRQRVLPPSGSLERASRAPPRPTGHSFQPASQARPLRGALAEVISDSMRRFSAASTRALLLLAMLAVIGHLPLACGCPLKDMAPGLPCCPTQPSQPHRLYAATIQVAQSNGCPLCQYGSYAWLQPAPVTALRLVLTARLASFPISDPFRQPAALHSLPRGPPVIAAVEWRGRQTYLYTLRLRI